MYKRAIALTAVMLLVGCSSGSGTTAQSAGGNPVRRGGQNLITADEIATSGAGLETAFDIVQRLRPSMVRSRASTFSTDNQAGQIPVVVYADEVKLGTVDNLRSIPAAQVREIRYLSATDATQRWGTGHSSGAIHVLTKR